MTKCDDKCICECRCKYYFEGSVKLRISFGKLWKIRIKILFTYFSIYILIFACIHVSARGEVEVICVCTEDECRRLLRIEPPGRQDGDWCPLWRHLTEAADEKNIENIHKHIRHTTCNNE